MPPVASLTDALRAALPGAVVRGQAELAGRDPGADARNLGASAQVCPRSTEEVAALVRLAGARGFSIVAQGGRTGLAGAAAAVEGQVICDMGAMAAIETIDPDARVAVVQAGVTLQALQEATRPLGLDPGIDLPSRGSCTIGGMIATNAGGIMAFRNGNMRHRVLGLEVVLPDGRVMSDLTRVLKTSAGLDLKHLFVGAEGTLGIVTRAAIRLQAVDGPSATALVGVPDASHAQQVIRHFLARPDSRLLSAEAMWHGFAAVMARMLGYTPGALPLDAPCLLIVELGAGTPEAAMAALEQGLAAIWDEAAIIDGVVATSQRQTEAIWLLREDTRQLWRAHDDPPSFDVSVPGGAVDSYVARITAELRALDPAYDPYVFGHLADGNLHITVNCDHPPPERYRAIEDILYRDLQTIGGCISAEHGVGIDKRAAAGRHADPVKLQLARALKATIDPGNLMNPGKGLPPAAG